MSPLCHNIRGRGGAIIQEDNAKQSRRAMLGSVEKYKRMLLPKRKERLEKTAGDVNIGGTANVG